MLNITSKYFKFFNNKPTASWVAHMTRHFLTCYSCLYYSSMHVEIYANIFRLWFNWWKYLREDQGAQNQILSNLFVNQSIQNARYIAAIELLFRLNMSKPNHCFISFSWFCAYTVQTGANIKQIFGNALFQAAK